MTEKDLDIAIEKCERIMEFDTRTMQNPVSEDGWIFEKVYELLKYLRQLQFATDTNVGGTDTISRVAAISICDNAIDLWNGQLGTGALVAVRDAIMALPSAQPGWIPCSTALPEYDGEYLVTKKSFGWNCKEYIETDIARYEKKDGWHKADTVLAWCELPTPYREGGQDG